MNTKCEYDFEYEVKKCLYEWLNRWRWKYFVSIQYPYENTDTFLYKWRKTLCKKHHLQDICYMGIFVKSKIKGKHIHLLLNTLENEEIKLPPSNPKPQSHTDKKIVHRRVDIECVYEQEGLTNYISFYNTPYKYWELVTPYNTELLDQYYRKS